MKHLSKIPALLIVLTLTLSAGACASGAKSKSSPPAYSTNGVAINGYDVVAYHTKKKAVMGKLPNIAKHGGLTYLFSSAGNRNLFIANPTKYKPQYDGYCAFAVAAKKARVPSNPKTFELKNGKLFLFFNAPYKGKVMNTKKMWMKNRDAMQLKADMNWKEIR